MRFIVLFFISLLYQFSYGQFYPVQSTPQLVPPYSVYLSDYATPGNEKLRVILVQRDLTHPSYQLRLVMSVELNGNIIMRTSRTYNPPPISLNPGIPTIISGGDLAPYLDSRNIDFVGYSKEQYERTKALPEGSYRIIFTAYDYRRQDVQVSNAGGTYYYLSKSEPPLINYPACGSTVAMRMPQQIVFSWLSRNTSSPGSAADTEYQLELFETRPAGRNPNDIVLSTQPVFKTLLSTTQYVYTPADPLLLENMVYVWRVRAIDRNGKDAIRNNGYSEVCMFTYSGIDPDFNIGVVKNLQAQARTERMARVWWDIGDFDSYRVNYRKTGNDYEWFTSDVLGNQLKEDSKDRGEIKLYDLEPDTEYEARVQGKKKGYVGGYTDIVKFRTPPHKVAQCGDNDSLPYGDMTKPSNAIIKGTIVQLDDMEMVLLNVTPLGNGWYRGIGKVSIDYFGGANFAVKFDRLFIDENHVAGYGRVDYISKGVAEMLVQQAENVAQKAKEQIWQQNRDAWAGTTFYSKVIAYDIAIDTITAEGIGYLTITDREGNTTTNAEAAQILLASPDKAIIIQDKNGDQYVVQKDKTTGHTKVTKVEGGGLQPETTEALALSDLDKMILISLRKYKTSIDEYLASNNQAQPSKGGGPSLLKWELEMFLAELPECLAGGKDRLDEIKSNIVSLLASNSTTFEDFVDIVKNRITEIDIGQEAVDRIVCEILTENLTVNIDSGLSTVVNGDTLTTANQIFIIKEQSFKINTKYVKDNSSEISFRLTVKPEGGGSDISNPASDWKKVQNNENWELELTSVNEGKYILAYKVNDKSTTVEYYVRKEKYDYACSVCGRNLKLTQTDLKQIFPNSSLINDDLNILNYFNESLKTGGFTTCHRQAHFFSQVFEESGGMNAKIEETSYPAKRMLEIYKGNSNVKTVFFKQAFWDQKDYLNYASKEVYETSIDTTVAKYIGDDLQTFKWSITTKSDTVRIPTTFTKKKKADYVKVSLTKVQQTANGERLFNLVYANKNGNGDVASGDGYKFRGRGAIQLTGRGTYRDVAKKCNTLFGTSYDWENNVDVLSDDHKAIVYSVASFFLWKFGDIKKLDTKDVTFVTKKVNGGTNGLNTRTRKFNEYISGRLNNCKTKK